MKCYIITLATTLMLHQSMIYAHDKLHHDIQNMPTVKPSNDKKNQKVQIALLLDTSNSMDGLINQAKSRLWDIVTTLSSLRSDGRPVEIEIALYEYGNSSLSSQNGYVRKVIGFTKDLDMISKNLYSLTTNGGDEYCAEVINQSLDQLDWTREGDALKMIYIAGNEGFNQGATNYQTVIQYKAQNQNVVVNTIFCGNYNEGVSTYWKAGADLGKGNYFAINSDQAITSVSTPYDEEINQYNTKLNSTYVYYGSEGKERAEQQKYEDKNAYNLSPMVSVKRIEVKSSDAYTNTSWDLVDKLETDSNYIQKVDKSTLPSEIKDKDIKEQEAYVKEKAKERTEIRSKINELNKKRKDYINSNVKSESDDDFGKAVTESIKTQANQKGYQMNQN